MASTSTTVGQPERVSTNTSQGTAPSPSTSEIASSPSLCSSCFDWVSSFIPWRSFQSNSMESTSTIDRIPENEVMCALEGMASTSTIDRIPENEVMGAIEGMASTSTIDRIPENEVMGTLEGMASTSTSDHIPENEVIGALEGMASTSTIDRIPENEVMGGLEGMTSTSTIDRTPENEVMGALEETAPSSFTSTKREAFKDIAPPPPASSSTLIRKPRYDVFINHCGPDVKQTLATSIYDVLKNTKVKAFLDSKELECGDFFPTTLEAAMRGASLHIAIFSENYAKSAWCLDELLFMLETGVKIFPVFYHVDPADLRHVDRRNGMYAEAFEEHKKKGRYNSEKLQNWKMALSRVSFYNGKIIKNEEDEMWLLKDIVSCVLKVMKNVPLVVAIHPVSLKEIVEDFKVNTLRSPHGGQVVQVVGIWGMGGAGKTTLAKELYNEISPSMERSSFVFNVRDAATKGLLHEKQKTLLNDLGVHDVAFDNLEEGMKFLSTGLRSDRVLVVLDDVDSVEQLDALLPAKDSLQSDSLIIVTTRSFDVLKSWGISSTYKMKPLDPLHAEELFCWHAFLNPRPRDGFKELVEKFLEACNGLPLSLKVFGAQLYGEFRKEYWESQLHRISRILPNKIKEILKISYDTLDDEEKEMFLDTACFFIGLKSSMVIEVWNGLGWSGLCGWEKLLHRCLVEIDDDNLIKMHDHLRDLGRDVANQLSPYRIWSPQQLINVEKYQEGRIGIRGIKKGKEDDCPVRCSRGELTAKTNCGIWSLAPSSVGLKYLMIVGDYFNQVMGEVTRELVWLWWDLIELRNLSSGLSLKKLSVLQLHGAFYLEELWGETDGEAPLQLRELFISYCHKFQGFPNSIGRLNHLKKIVIIGGYNVRSLPDEFCLLKSLEHLELDGCQMLSSLPSNFGNLINLRHLSLRNCYELSRLPVSFKSLMLLEHLDLDDCSQLTFTSEDLNILENISKLEYLSLSGCKQVEELPRHITNQVSLRTLDFNYTTVKELPDDIGQLSRLRKMRIAGVLSTSLPTSLGDLTSLTYLSIGPCCELECLPDSLGDLTSLTILHISDCPKLECLPVSLGALSSLTYLQIRVCPKLECLPVSLGALSSLTYLTIYECQNLGCLPDSLGALSSLTYLLIHECQNLGCLPDSLRDLSSLTHLSIHECPNLGCLPKSLRDLSSLTRLSIENCSKLDCLSDSLGDLSSLMNLSIKNCSKLECLPDSLRNLSSLTYLSIQKCSKLKCLPDSLLRDLSSLTTLTISDCPKLECLPDSLVDFSSSTYLSISIQECPKVRCHGDMSDLNLEVSNCAKLEPLLKSLSKSIRSLRMKHCLIRELDFVFSNLKYIDLTETELCRISFSEDCCPHLETLSIQENHHLEEIEALPRAVESISLTNCEMLKNIPSFARLTSLGEFSLTGCYGVEKIEGLENCTRLESLTVETCSEVPGIESLEHMENLKNLDLRTNNGSVIERWIQMIQKWQEEVEIHKRAVPEASSLVDSSVSPNLVVVDSFSNQRIKSGSKLVQGRFDSESNGDAIMLCFVINCVSSEMSLKILWRYEDRVIFAEYPPKFEKGRWAWVSVFTRPSGFPRTPVEMMGKYREFPADEFSVECCTDDFSEEAEVEKGLVVSGEKQRLLQAVAKLKANVQPHNY